MSPYKRPLCFLVRYFEDGIFQLCRKSSIKYKKGRCFIRYVDNIFYPGSVIFQSGDVEILQAMVNQLTMEPSVQLLWKNEDSQDSPGNSDQLIKNLDEEEVSNEMIERDMEVVKTKEKEEEISPASVIIIEDIKLDRNGNIVQTKIYENTSETIKFNKKFKGKKKEYCIFCKSLKTQLARHFVSCHKEEVPVKHFMCLPLQSIERRKCINTLRKEGQFENNSKQSQSTYLSMRRSSSKGTKIKDIKICPNCKGYYRRLRFHVQRCNPKWRGQRSVNTLGNLLTQNIHPAAGERLKKIFAILRQDEVKNIVANDELIIICSNRWAEKYKNIKDDNMIRARIRLLGRFLIEFNKLSSKSYSLKEIFNPQLNQYVIQAINSVANLGSEIDSSEVYAHPCTARNLGHLLKKCVQIYKYVLIENKEKDKKEDLEDFCVLLNQNLTDSINKTVTENMSEIKRLKNIKLPLEEDILLLKRYVCNRASVFLKRLEANISLANYKVLASFVLVSLIIFNRRRPGETERLKICDFISCQSDSVTTVSMGKEYSRLFIRGKLGRTVKLYIDSFQKLCVESLLNFREQVGVDSSNPYVFGLPDIGDQVKYLRACPYFREYSLECGAKHPELLRATLLRKEVATKAANLELNDAQVGDLAEFMGHAEKVHRDHYRISEQCREVNVLNLLNKQVENDSQVEFQNEKKREEMQAIKNSCPSSEEASSDESSIKNIAIKQKRTYWTEEEKLNLQSNFEENINTQTSPSLVECAIFKKQNSLNKSVEAIKAFVNNTIAKKKRRSCERLSWSNDEVNEVKKMFKSNLNKAKLPSEFECKMFLESSNIMKQRSPLSVKLWIYNHLKNKNEKLCSNSF